MERPCRATGRWRHGALCRALLAVLHLGGERVELLARQAQRPAHLPQSQALAKADQRRHQGSMAAPARERVLDDGLAGLYAPVILPWSVRHG